MKELSNQDVRDLVEDATRHHGAPWRRVVSSDGGFYGVTDRNGSVVAGSPAVTALIAQAPTLIPELLDRLEQDEQAVQRVREMHERIPVLVNDRWEIDHCKFCYEQDFSSDDAVWPCPTIRALDGDTRRLADQGLGDNLARTTKNGENND